MKTITFVFPGDGSKPVGGFKIIFEYANRLIEDGHKVNIIFPATLLWSERSNLVKIKGIFKYFCYNFNPSKYKPYNWFPLNKKIKIYWKPTLENRYIPKGDIIFATSCETSEYVKNYSIDKGEKYYFIQHFEEWYFDKERVLKTWKYNLKKIVIANWLLEISRKIDEKSTVIYNGLDHAFFNIDIDIKKRNSKSIIMLYHEAQWKGSEIGLKAIKIVKKEYPDIEVTMFGVYDKPNNLPKYIKYYKSPSQNILKKLYNKSAIYLGTSYGEGWGLTVAEAMQCGCAVVCTNVFGYNEMVKNLKTGLKCKPGDSDDLAEKIKIFLKDSSLRIEIANRGNKFIKRFTWEKSYKKLKKILNL